MKREREHSQCKVPGNNFKIVIEENFPNLKSLVAVKEQEAYRKPSRFDQKRDSSRCLINKTLNAQNKARILKVVREKVPSNI